jgi:hypothetical protein
MARLLVPTGRLLLTDAGGITGPISNEEVERRSVKCRTSESFIQKLEEARGSGSSRAQMWSVPALQTSEDSTLNARTNDVLRRFNRETKRLVAGVLVVVTFGALAFAVLVPERQLKMVVDPVAAQTANPVLVLNSQINQLREQPNGSKWSTEPKDSTRAIRILIRRKRHQPLDHLNVKMRLLALWHRSLTRNSSRGWTLFSAKGEEDNGSYTAHAGH